MSNKNKKTIFVIAGETSGDMRGGPLLQHMKKLRPDLRFIGIGGDHMAEQGMELLYHSREMAFLGFFEVVRHYPFIRKVFYHLVDTVRKEKPSMIILIDYPGFNLRFARKMHELGIPMLYYISPQVWAWGKDRVKKIAKWIGRLLVILPFEKAIYEKEGMDVHFVGHPLRDEVVPPDSSRSFLKSLNFSEKQPILGLLPGSRRQEVEKLLPDILTGYKLLKQQIPDLQAVLGMAPTLSDEFYHQFLNPNEIKCVRDQSYNVMAHSDAVFVASGTATLETGLLGTPMVIVYRIAPISYLMGKYLVKIKNIGLVNIVAGETVVPERIQDDVNGKTLAETMYPLLADKKVQKEIKEKLHRVQDNLGEKGASKRAAEKAVEYLNRL